MAKKKLHLSNNKMLGGVIAGFAEYIGVDVTLLRVLFAFFVIVTGFFPGIFMYVVAWFIMNRNSHDDIIDVSAKQRK